MAKSLGKYLDSYNTSLMEKYGESFGYNTFLNFVKKGGFRITGLSNNAFKESIDLPWIDELEIVTEKIMAIASNPRSHIKFEKEVKQSSKAVKIDNFDIIETIKVPKFWRKKEERFLPEKVFTDNYETELAIYENRFIINLVDKIILFLSQMSNQLLEKIRKVNKNFIDFNVAISDIDILQELANYDEIPANTALSRLYNKDKNATLLTTANSPYVNALRRVLEAKSSITHVLSTPFYKAVKKAKPLGDSDVHITNMLAGDRTYAPCYNFYRKLLSLLSKEKDDEDIVNIKDYHDFVLTNLFKALDDIGFVTTSLARESLVKYRNGFMNLDGFKVKKGNLTCLINTKHDDHIDINFELSSSSAKSVSNIGLKRKSFISIDLVPQTTMEYATDEELQPYFKKKIASRLSSGYTNAFVVTAVDNTQKDDVIICSPYIFKIDANIKSMLESCIIFAEADNYIYSHLCPICGYYVDGEQEDGNCYCPNCESVYTLFISNNEKKEKKESVWIKRLKNPERF